MACRTARGNLSRGEAIEAEEMRETLTCEICFDILYDCTSAQPCLHSFCGGCISEWISRPSSLGSCPTCRKPVEKLAVNHRLNSAVESYLKHHPDEVRDAKERADLDERNDVRSSGGVFEVGSRNRERRQNEFPVSDDADYDTGYENSWHRQRERAHAQAGREGFGWGWVAGAVVVGVGVGVVLGAGVPAVAAGLTTAFKYAKQLKNLKQ